jgi:antitoxin component YwqK of YwqJK toxin-antitoxin module
MECIICYQEETDEAKFMCPNPCICKGTIHIHETCYKEIRNRFGACSICKMTYPLQKPVYIDGIATMTRFEDGFKIVYTINEAGQKHGTEVTWCLSDGERKVEEAQWHNGARQGIMRTWYHNGAIESLVGWHDNRRHGIELHWHENGKEASETHWDHGTKDGFEKICSETGYVISITPWLNNLIHGTQEVWIEEGLLYKKIEWSYGKKHGRETCWSCNRQKLVQVIEWREDEIMKSHTGKKAWRTLDL